MKNQHQMQHTCEVERNSFFFNWKKTTEKLARDIHQQDLQLLSQQKVVLSIDSGGWIILRTSLFSLFLKKTVK